MTKDKALELLNIYGKAWIDRDPNLILEIFTSEATYDDPREEKNFRHEGIYNYWVTKVVDGQRDIKFKILNVWIEGNTVIAEWEAEFIDIKRNLKIEMVEVAIFTVLGEKFSSLREYYKSVKTPLS